ncbi:MAG: DUF3256 family protein [Paramuribaculum sp.]|nr:DUF3256 family protein [Paramuribaculum sp.]
MNKLITTAAALILGFGAAFAQLTASKAFVEAPRNVLPLLDRNARLDMLDYFNSGLTTKTSNKLNGSSAVTAVSPEQVAVQMTDASICHIAVIPSSNDSLIAVIATVNTPAPDSKMTVYSSDFKRDLTTSVFSKPTLKEWLTDGSSLGTVEAMVPFLLISYSYDPATGILTLSNNTETFLSEDIYTIVEPYLKKEIRYKWTGKKFAKQ